MKTLPRKITRMLTIPWPFNMDLNLQRKRHFKKDPYTCFWVEWHLGINQPIYREDKEISISLL